MKKTLKSIILIIVVIISLSMHTTEKDFHVWVEQDGKKINAANNELTIKKKEFTLFFDFSEPMGILINASFNDQTYKSATEGNDIYELQGFKETGMAENLNNPNKEILLAKNAPSYWFYDDMQTHRFDNVEKKNGKYICRRLIKNLYDIDNKKNIKAENVESPLYLVFISYKYEEDSYERIELKREMIKINWN